MSSTFTPEAKRLFMEIREEYELQAPTLTGPTPYTDALLTLQKRLLDTKEDVQIIRQEFEQLKAKGHESSN